MLASIGFLGLHLLEDGESDFEFVDPGTYTVSETDPSSILFALQSIVCSDGNSTGAVSTGGAGGTATYRVHSGETVTCVFTNVKQFHPGTIGFWRNWRNHYTPAEFQILINYIKKNNPTVYASLTIARYDAIFLFGKKLSRDQMILAQLTGVKSNLAISDPCIQAQGLTQKNDDLFLNGSLVDLSNIPGAQDYFDTNNDDVVTVQEVVAKVESKWTGTLQNPYGSNFNGFSSFSPLTDDQVISVLAGINEGSLVMDQGTGPTGLC